MKTYFVTGIGTEVGKTIASAIITQALEADYWKPVQAGELDQSDSMKVKSLISNNQSKFHEEAFRLNEPMSPHAAAEKDKVHIDISSMKAPLTNNHLVIEGAGGLLVPLNDKETILNLIEVLRCEVILVSRHYLGSINHTLMSIEILKQRNIQIKGILFNGDENKDTEAIISKMSGIDILGRIPELTDLNKSTINSVAQNLKNELI
ncbi:dethiobiotin synthase [Flavobacteriales bacterium]|jgi:dethiobiotin synthetase|nr:dethiobiotin synthase [Flavobacteriales bacterium]